ncbi:MAG: polysaccharide deacetylase family protein [Candidatus Omnitrophota bacterium]
MKRIYRIIGFLAVILLLLAGALFCWLSDKYTVPIMMYHNVNSVVNPIAPTVSPEYFRRHMEFLKRNHYRVISLDEFVEAMSSGKRLPRKSVVITFDDGYEDNYIFALPVLREHHFPATIFVPPAKIGQEGRLTWAQLREMVGQDVTIGSHTFHERYLPHLPYDNQREEIFESKRILEEKLGVAVNYLSYPIGGFNDKIKQDVRDAGYKAACSTNRGSNRFNRDLYELNRIRFGDPDNSGIILRVKLSGYYNLFRKYKSPH